MRKHKHILLERVEKLKISLKATNIIWEVFVDEVERNKIKRKTWIFLKIQKINNGRGREDIVFLRAT